eukprot:499297-Prymnesium_polylepis.1
MEPSASSGRTRARSCTCTCTAARLRRSPAGRSGAWTAATRCAQAQTPGTGPHAPCKLSRFCRLVHTVRKPTQLAVRERVCAHVHQTAAALEAGPDRCCT